MKPFLTLKHWQLFLLVFVVPIVLQIFLVIYVALTEDPLGILRIYPFLMVLVAGLFFAWLYALGINLYKKLPVTAPMNLTKFKIFLFIPFAYILLLSFAMMSLPFGHSQGDAPNPVYFLLIIPVHLFSMFCIFYCLYFVAKAFKSVELQKPLEFGDFIGEFFLLWFFPVGVWILQPKLNRLFSNPDSEKQGQESENIHL